MHTFNSPARLSKEITDHLQNCVCTIKMLAEVLVEDDSRQGSTPEAILSLRGTAAIHDAIRLISDQADDKCEALKHCLPEARELR